MPPSAKRFAELLLNLAQAADALRAKHKLAWRMGAA
jgi:hypothetical protein